MFDRFKKIIDDYTIPFFWMLYNLLFMSFPNTGALLNSNKSFHFTLLFLVSILCGLTPLMFERVKKFANDYTFHFFWIILNLLLIYDILFIRELDSKSFILLLLVLTSIVCSFSAFWKFVFKIKKGTLAMTLFSSLFISIFAGVKSLNSEETFLFALKYFFSKETNIIRFILLISALYSLSVLWKFVFKRVRLKIIKVFLSIMSCLICISVHTSLPLLCMALDALNLIKEFKGIKKGITKSIDIDEIKQSYNEVNKIQKMFQRYKDIRLLFSHREKMRDAIEQSIKAKARMEERISKISLCLSEDGRYKKECAEIRKKKKTLTRKVGSHSDSSQSQQ